MKNNSLKIPTYLKKLIKSYPNIKSGRKNFSYHHQRIAKTLKLLKKYNCLAIIQPLGSKNDKKIIDFAKQNKIPLYFTKNRVFKH